MGWIRKGKIWTPGGAWWSHQLGTCPVPVLLPKENRIRIYFGTADKDMFGRITFIEVNANDPAQIMYQHESFILDVGADGTFDDCGVLPMCYVDRGTEKFLYTSTFQRFVKTPYTNFPGLAVSENGIDFRRFSQAPIIDRSAESPYGTSTSFVLPIDGGYRMWNWFATRWVKIYGKYYYDYTLSHGDSDDGIHWRCSNRPCLPFDEENGEFAQGKPWVVFHAGVFHLWYCSRYIDHVRRRANYRIGYVHSPDGVQWTRGDKGLDTSGAGWDSEMTTYPAVIRINDKWLMFYCGNEHGREGFGYAEWEGRF